MAQKGTPRPIPTSQVRNLGRPVTLSRRMGSSDVSGVVERPARRIGPVGQATVPGSRESPGSLTALVASPYNGIMSSTAKNTVSVDIGGTKYRMVTDTDADHLRRLAAQVNERIDALGDRTTRTLSAAQLLAIVSLTLAEELENAERQLGQVKETHRTRTDRALQAIDAALLAAARASEATADSRSST